MSSSPHNPKESLNRDSLSYILNELGEERENYFNAISAPIIQTSNFAFKKVDDLSRALEDEMNAYLYSRGLNPTVEILRKKLAALDSAEDCLVFNSGAAAIFAELADHAGGGLDRPGSADDHCPDPLCAESKHQHHDARRHGGGGRTHH